MAVLDEELKKITQTLQNAGVQGSSQPKPDLSSLYGGGNADIVKILDNKLTASVEGRTAFSPLNKIPEVRTKVGYTVLNKEFESDNVGKLALAATPYTGISYDLARGAAPIFGGSLAVQHEKTGARFSIDGSFSPSSTGNMGSPSTPSATAAAGFSIPF